MSTVTVEPYRRVLAIRGVRALMLVGLLARIPVVAIGLTLTLHVVTTMKLGFLQAGLVGAASTGGVAIGAPVAGRFVDRYGLRPVVAVCTAGELLFWSCAAFLPYWPLVAAGLINGVLSLPVFSLVRQCLAAVVPAERHRTAFALDSMLIEVSYMVGPAVAVAATNAVGSRWTMAIVGAGLVGSGVALLTLNPPTRGADEPAVTGAAVPRRQWLTPALLALLGITFAATLVLGATELSLVAVLKADAATRWTGVAVASLSLSSLIGGFVYGGLSRGFSPALLVGGMAALTLPVGLAAPWPLLCLALVPAGLLCAPALSTTIDAVNRQVPATARGEAVGLHSTALTLGLAASGPIAGFLIDDWGTRWSFALTSLGGLVLVAVAVPLCRPALRPALAEG
jgi:MFS family permease